MARYFSESEKYRIPDRKVDELIGISRALVADGVLDNAELRFLDRWASANQDIQDAPLVESLFEQLGDVLAKGRIEPDERSALVETMRKLTGDIRQDGNFTPATLPLCDPPPDIEFEGRIFCFTGTFDYGTRRDCESEIRLRGGEPQGISAHINYLVIGSRVTPSWLHSSYGTKIIKASRWREDGYRIAIVSEAHWVKHL